MGVAYAQQGDLRAAIRHFGNAVKLDPNYEDARRNLEMAQKDLQRRIPGRE
ncbi:MAG: tetratricopeptide repeat protein [Planctomycetota bacterium]